MSSPHPVIAIDGPAASGKSTFGRALARRLGYLFISTGAMYRGITWFLLQKQIHLDDPGAVVLALSRVRLQTELQGQDFRFLIDGIDASPFLREGSINQGVSLASQIPEVRRLLVEEQRRLQFAGPLVMEGRDVGTVVFPESPFKFYLDADVSVRAARRSGQGHEDAVSRRDELDQTRVASPLVCAQDAIRLDSGKFQVDELVEQALRILRDKGGELDPRFTT